jgi:hypothetical protein
MIEYELKMELEEQMADRCVSAEQSAVMATYNELHGLNFRKVKTNYNDGIAQVIDYLETYASHEPHPFREVSRRLYYPEQKPIMGRPHLFLVVDDEQGMLHYDYTLNRWYVSPPKDNLGLKRTREEFPVYHYKRTEAGKAVQKQRPFKLFDDAMDCLRYAANVFFPPLTGMTKKAKLEASLPVTLREANIRQESPQEMARSYIARMEYMRENSMLPSQQRNQKVATNYKDTLFERAMRQYETTHGRVRTT